MRWTSGEHVKTEASAVDHTAEVKTELQREVSHPPCYLTRKRVCPLNRGKACLRWAVGFATQGGVHFSLEFQGAL